MSFIADPSAANQTRQWNEAWLRDGKCHVDFHKMPMLDERASYGYTEEREVTNDDGSLRMEKKRFPGAGRPIYRETVFIRIYTPGDATNIPDREMTEQDKVQYAAEFAQWQSGAGAEVVGSPLEMLPGLNSARIEEFKSFPKAPVRTIEELAALSDTAAKGFLCMDERERARKWLEAMKQQAPVANLQAQLTERDRQIAELRAEVETLAATMRASATVKTEVDPTPKRGPGRPPKVRQASEAQE